MTGKELELTAEIVVSFVSRNAVSPEALAPLIRSVHEALTNSAAPSSEPASSAPRAASPAEIRKSIRPDALISFEDGRPYRVLRRHLSALGLTPELYRAKWGLPDSYPMTAPDYSAARSELARAMGLGQAGRVAAGRRGGKPKA